jgi:hypothetical protein
LRQSCAVFFRNLQICDLWINHKKFPICDLLTGTPNKFGDLRKQNSVRPRTFGFADFKKKFACPPLCAFVSLLFDFILPLPPSQTPPPSPSPIPRIFILLPEKRNFHHIGRISCYKRTLFKRLLKQKFP